MAPCTPGKRLVGAALALVLLAVLVPGDAGARAMTAAKVKAAVVFNFAKFVAWPDGVEDVEGPFVIGVCGAPELEAHLLDLAAHPVRGRRLEVLSVDPAEPLAACRILFVGEEACLELMDGDLADRPVLTVSDRPDFLERGGMVLLHLSKARRICFDVDEKAVRSAGMEVSSKLLRLKKSSD